MDPVILPGAPAGQPGLPQAEAAPAEFSAAEMERRRLRRAAKAAKHRAKRHEYEAPEINIVAMMDMMTIILVYLLKGYASDPVQITPSQDTQLPMSSTQLSPQEAVQVAITSKVILVNDKTVARVRDGRVAAEAKKDNNPAQMMVPPLFEALRAEGDRQKLFARYNKSKSELQFKGLLTVIADKRVPFRLLTEVLYTAGQAEYGQYKFAVIKKE
ncbi:MAG TPA: biopolymer transporter ExbD [Myxococcota bacterium]|nr:biopolymer transporter ExbD [Myxococcota bacterium]HRY95030.1 biopolymer transporter ExbD [Myxococcota bacterium]